MVQRHPDCYQSMVQPVCSIPFGWTNWPSKSSVHDPRIRISCISIPSTTPLKSQKLIENVSSRSGACLRAPYST